MTERRRSRRPSPANTVSFGVALFVAVLALLAWQVRVGRDPSLDAKRPVLSASATPPHRVLVRVIRRKVIKEKVVYIPPAQTPAPANGGSSVSAPAASSSYSAPAPTYSAPASTYSAPAPAAAPAPAPAPVVTATS